MYGPLRFTAVAVLATYLTFAVATDHAAASRAESAGVVFAPPASGLSRTLSRSSATPATIAPAPLLLDWTPCDAAAASVLCTRLDVPLDYAHPAEASITITVARRASRVSALRIGSLLVNPGGPGASAVDLVRGLPLPAAITDRFDIVGVEPRGLERATPVRCAASALKSLALGTTPGASAAAAYARSCGRLSGRLLPFVNSEAAARDVETVRAALGESTISLLTYSYGSRIATEYRRLYPSRLRAMVVDAPVDPAQPLLSGHIEALDTALGAFLRDCDAAGPAPTPSAADGPGCVLAQRGAARSLERAEARFANGPVASAGRSNATIDRARFETTLVTLLANGNFRSLAQVIEDTSDGSSNWLTSAIAVLGVDPGSFRPPGDGTNGAFEAYLCRDPHQPDLAVPSSRHFGAYAAQRFALLRCRAWPVPPLPLRRPTQPNQVVGYGPALVVATTYDVRSPLRWAQSVAAQLDAPLLRFAAAGHTIVGQGNACVDRQITAFLLRPSPATTVEQC